jgi:hypothetical protein
MVGIESIVEGSHTGQLCVEFASDVLTVDDHMMEAKSNGVVTKVIYGHIGSSPSLETASLIDSNVHNTSFKIRLDNIIRTALHPLALKSGLLTGDDKEWLWQQRYHLLEQSSALPAFVLSLQWSNATRVQEFYALLDMWHPVSPAVAMQLLDRRIADPIVRAYVAHRLESLSDEELARHMLQLIQQLKYEPYMDSALARFLLRRAVKSRRYIGHLLFWQLEAEISTRTAVASRYRALLQVYLLNCGKHRLEVGRQMLVMRKLEKVATSVTRGGSKSERSKILRCV